MAKSWIWIICVGIVVSAVQAGVVVEHPPDQSGAQPSDTDYPFAGSTGHSQRLADDFMLTQAGTIEQVTWWGGYWFATPPSAETIRIRVYGTESASVLPGNVLAESIVANPLRVSTGQLFANAYREYRFHADLSSPLALVPNVRYWLEIAQLGDSSSPLVWELSAAEQDGFAWSSPSDAPWQATSPGKDLAFELSMVPEPATIILGVAMMSLVARKRR